MANILMISSEKGFLPMSIKSHFEHAAHNVVMAPVDIDAINRISVPVHFVVLYFGDNLTEDFQPLYFLKDRIIAENIPMAVIGELIPIKKIKTIVPEDFIRFEFVRPINVRNIVDTIVRFLQQNDGRDKKKVLVVDDSGAMLRTVKGWLEEEYDVFLANSGAMAIKYLTLNRPDLVLLDYEMPVCDGKTVLEMIRTEADFSDIPVMFLTGHGDKKTIMELMALKPNGYLLKSQDPAQILEAIEILFSKQKAGLKAGR